MHAKKKNNKKTKKQKKKQKKNGSRDAIFPEIWLLVQSPCLGHNFLIDLRNIAKFNGIIYCRMLIKTGSCDTIFPEYSPLIKNVSML